jgi:alpha/beta superfamily hydrolase
LLVISASDPANLVRDPASSSPGPLFTGVKEQVTGTYAEALTGAGYVTLAFDHRGFGGSEGTPRQHEDPAGNSTISVTRSAG